VYWILPAIKPEVQEIVRRIAVENGDVILPIKDLSTDRVHPTTKGYRQLAEATKDK
jgi:lysophospholipase L1-like esterase